MPGVFGQNPSHKVNSQLWTIPYELECYLLLTALAVFGLHRRRVMFLSFVVGLTALLQGRALFIGADGGRALVLCFLVGVCGYLFRDHIRWNGRIFAGCTAATIVLQLVPSLAFLVAFPVTYVIIYLGLKNPAKSRFLESGDYSYGLFLYGYPLQQALVSGVPLARHWYGNILLALPLALGFAMLSWHLVEKRVLARKRLLYAIGPWWNGRFPSAFAIAGRYVCDRTEESAAPLRDDRKG